MILEIIGLLQEWVKEHFLRAASFEEVRSK